MARERELQSAANKIYTIFIKKCKAEMLVILMFSYFKSFESKSLWIVSDTKRNLTSAHLCSYSGAPSSSPPK